jgi:hypothetical protein
MLAQLEERRRVMFPKSSVFAVVALAAFMSLGVLLLPQVVQAQCVWDCDLGSDPSFNPWGNSPQALDIVYCFDRDCVRKLEVQQGSGNFIFTGDSIPTPSVAQDKLSTACGTVVSPTLTDVKIEGDVVALLRDQRTGNLDPNSAANAHLKIVIKDVKCSSGGPGGTTLSRVVQLNEPQTNVFGDSSITIKAPTSSTPANLPALGWTGCTTDKKTGKLLSDCPFPLGTVVYTKLSDRDAQLPQDLFYVGGEVYRAVETSTTTPRQVGVRDCKGDANSTDPSTITCTRGSTVAVGGGESVALFTFLGNYAGATTHTINENGTSNPFDIVTAPTSLFANIDPTSVTGSANNGPQVALTGCFDQVNQQTERCFISAQALLPNGCIKGQPVAILVEGNLVIGGQTFRFVARDTPTCAN